MGKLQGLLIFILAFSPLCVVGASAKGPSPECPKISPSQIDFSTCVHYLTLEGAEFSVAQIEAIQAYTQIASRAYARLTYQERESYYQLSKRGKEFSQENYTKRYSTEPLDNDFKTTPYEDGLTKKLSSFMKEEASKMGLSELEYTKASLAFLKLESVEAGEMYGKKPEPKSGEGQEGKSDSSQPATQ